MAQGEVIKNLVKPPFANYDIVVYFGCGLFALPFIRHYLIEPFALRFPIFTFELGIPFAGVLVATLSLLFAVYILGHIIAYVSSQLIEKAMEMAFAGKTSAVILSASEATDETRKATFRARLRKGRENARKPHAMVAAIIRGATHLPLLILLQYPLLVWLGMFGFYSTRVPPTIIAAARERLADMNLKVEIEEGSQWFKALEGYVINNYPIATARMYNYLVISGLFRSIALIFLGAMWMEIIHVILTWFGREPLGFFLSDTGGPVRWLFGYATLSMIYLFSLFSFLKFQRRYVEEAIFAFVLTKAD